MQQKLHPVDVICLSGADGQIVPLRIRAEHFFEETMVGSVCEILQTKQNNRYGAESRTFLCRVRLPGTVCVLELKFFQRSHSWYLSVPSG